MSNIVIPGQTFPTKLVDANDADITHLPVKLYDANGNEITTMTDNNNIFIAIRDDEQLDILQNILTELRKLNMQLMFITENKLEGTDVED